MTQQTAPSAVLDRTLAEDLETPNALVQPPDYMQLRLLAECAVAINEQEVTYFFPGGKDLQRADGTTPLGDDDILVPTYNDGKYPASTVSLGLTSTLVPGQELPLAGADALFWSDAAVEKFLLPFIASCGWRDAAALVLKVQQAWNDYPADKVSVYALVHMNTIPANVPLSLENSLQVAYAEQLPGATLKLMPLPDFVVKFPPNAPAAPVVGQVGYHRGAGTRAAPFPDYLALRAMAEWAGSLRDQPGYFLFPAGQTGFLPPTPGLPSPLADGDIVIPAFTPASPQERPQLQAVWFQGPGGTVPMNLVTEGDALFLSTGAIDQLLYPYYASKGGVDGLLDLWQIGYVWTGDWWTGLPQSVLTTGQVQVAAPDGGTSTVEVSSAAPPEPDVVFALIHLPSSQWTEITQEGAGQPEGPLVETRVTTRIDPKRHLGVVTVDSSGGTHVNRVAEFMANHPSAAA